MTALVVKFVNKVKNTTRTKSNSGSETEILTAPELTNAEELWIKAVQAFSFDEEIKFLREGRMNNAEFLGSARNPILLPEKHDFVQLIIKKVHASVKHCGLRDTLTTIRERFWILRGREAVKRVIKKCVICLRINGMPYKSQSTPDLPSERVSEDPPFVVMEEFRKVCRTNYGLDPVWYYTAPGLAWDTALKISQVELELLSDPDMLLFFERGIRGGVSTIFHRRAQANNKYMKDYDKSKPSVFVPYWDANGLYAWAMSHPLPVDKFEWMSDNELENWENIPCVLEVDVDIPEELHDKFNDFPPLPEKVKIGGVQKLVPNLWNKRKIVVHRKILKQAIELGCVLKKVWKGLKFREEAWLKDFIEINVKLRQEAKNTFEKNFFKLMNNAVFGKTMENLRKRTTIELVCDEKKFLKLVAKSNYEHSTRFAENLVGVHMKKAKIMFNKPVYVGQAILDISKTCMYDFHYKYVKEKWSKSQLCFTDTDSLLYMIETDDLFEDISGDIAENFDTSDFPSDHPKVLDGTIKRMNKKVLGMMKDETFGMPIVDFVGLKAKCYSFILEESGKRKCKGIKKDVIKRMEHKDWITCLNEQNVLMKEMTCFRSNKHDIATVVLNKVALNANDDKRVVMADGISTFAHGHWRIGNGREELCKERKWKELVLEENKEEEMSQTIGEIKQERKDSKREEVISYFKANKHRVISENELANLRFKYSKKAVSDVIKTMKFDAMLPIEN